MRGIQTEPTYLCGILQGHTALTERMDCNIDHAGWRGDAGDWPAGRDSLRFNLATMYDTGEGRVGDMFAFRGVL